MRSSWLNLILRLSNAIFQRKQQLLGEQGLRVVVSILILFFLEGILVVVSFPLYISVGPEKVTAFFVEKGAYARVAFDYRLRRILTLTGVTILLLILTVKFMTILIVPAVLGPLQIYSISPIRLPSMTQLSEEELLLETGIQTADLVQSLTAPVITQVERTKNHRFIFSGTGEPHASLVLFVTDKQTAIYTGEIDARGNWQIVQEDTSFQLQEGNHEIRSFSFDSSSGTRSDFSSDQYFKVETTLADALIRRIDTIANGAIIFVIFFGALLILVTI